jgi:hypothetical protein
MVILQKSCGDHSNRLIQNIHFEAFCYEYGIPYYNPTFLNMREYYISPVNSEPKIPDEIDKKFLSFNKKSIKDSYDSVVNNPQAGCLDMLLNNSKNSCCYVGGWHFRVYELTEKHQDYFAKKYTIKEEYYLKNDIYNNLIKNRDKNITLIGVHVRRGDYKFWRHGQYYFDDDTYQRYIASVKREIAKSSGKRCIFIIFSNETVDLLMNSDIIISKNIWYVDHFLMSKCDYLIGPPSTFTLWASYIGKNKYYHITDNSGDIDVNKFQSSKG